MKRFLPILAAVCLIFGGCNKAEQEQSGSLPHEIIVSGAEQEISEPSVFPLEVCGVEVKAEPKTVVSLSPAVTEIIHELGLSRKITAVSSYCDYPELSVPTVGSSENPDIAAITELKPDIVFTLSALAERDIYALNDAGCTVIQLSVPKTLEEYGRLYRDVASAFIGAEAAAPYGEAAIAQLTDASEQVELGGFIYVTDKLTAAGNGTFESSVLSLSGENLCTADGYTELSELPEISPDFIIVSDKLTLTDVSYDEVLSVYIYNGAEVVFVSPASFERPTIRTAKVFDTIADTVVATAEAE